MKYIRTKDGRIMEVPYGFTWNVEKTLAVSDTIEELISRYVVRKTMYKIYTKLQFGKLSMNKVKDMFSKGYEIFGAIWTTKGLIYVAKMKGILPNGEIDWELL